QEAAAAGKLSVSDWYAISRVGEGEQTELLEQKLRGATRDALERAGKKKRSEDSVRVIRIKCPLPGGQSVVVSGEGLALSQMMQRLAELLRQAKKAKDDGLDASTFQRVLTDKAKCA